MRAEVLLWRGLDEKVLSLLAESLPSRFAATDFAARRQACKAIAHGHLHQFEQAQAALADAEQLANTKQPQLLGEVFLAKGSVALARGALGEALSFFQVAWNQARLYKQPFLETNAAGSLGRTLVWLEHYDAAIDWFTNSLQLSQSLNARASSAKTLGNIGWSYREMGDLENALSQFAQAESAAHGAGLVVDEARWLSSVGDVYYDLHNYSAAQLNSSEALKLADSLHDSPFVGKPRQALRKPMPLEASSSWRNASLPRRSIPSPRLAIPSSTKISGCLSSPAPSVFTINM